LVWKEKKRKGKERKGKKGKKRKGKVREKIWEKVRIKQE
jgi:hypothetical protein